MVSDRHRLLSKRQSQSTCIVCPEVAPCACNSGQICVEVNRSCDACGHNECIASPTPTPDTLPASSGISTGALAGAVAATSVLLILVLLALFFFLWRRKHRKTVFEEKKEAPAPAAEVLQRPDTLHVPPVAAYRSPTTSSFSAGESSANFQGSYINSYDATQGHTPWSSNSQPYTAADLGHSNPNLISATFNHSLHADSDSSMLQTLRDQAEMPPLSPNVRAALGVPIDRNRGDSRLQPPPRQVRDSFNTSSSFSSELSVEPVMTKGMVRQVLGFTRAEVVHTPKHSMSSVHPSVYTNRMSGTPSSLGFAGREYSHAPPIPSRLGKRSLEPLRNPFSDSRAPSPSRPSPDSPSSATNLVQHSPAPSSATFGDTGSPFRKSWAKQTHTSDQSSKAGRPVSVSTNSDSVSSSASSHEQLVPKLNRSPQTMLVPPSHDLPHTPLTAPFSAALSPNVPGPSSGVLEQQQRQAIDKANAKSSRMSVHSTASSITDSLLSTFPFVPPSPVNSSGSHRSIPLRSPLSQLSIVGARDVRNTDNDNEYPDTVASLLESSPIDTQPSSSAGRHRASLDTVALSSDLMKYPLFYDRKGKGKETQ